MWKELTSCWKRYETRNRKKKSKGFYSVIRDWWLHSSSLKTDIIHNCKIFLEKNSLIIHFTFCSICLKSRNISAILPLILYFLSKFHVLEILPPYRLLVAYLNFLFGLICIFNGAFLYFVGYSLDQLIFQFVHHYAFEDLISQSTVRYFLKEKWFYKSVINGINSIEFMLTFVLSTIPPIPKNAFMFET